MQQKIKKYLTKKKSRKPDKISVSAILNLYFLVRKCLSPDYNTIVDNKFKVGT